MPSGLTGLKMSMIVRKYSKFRSIHKHTHGIVVKRTAKNILDTINEDLVLAPGTPKGLETSEDADFW